MMHKKLTVTLDERVHDRLPNAIEQDLPSAYQEMARDESRESEALGWAEETVRDVADGTR